MNAWATMRVVAVVAILLAGGATRLTAQAGVIRGRVVRADQPVGLADADVSLGASGFRTSTDPRGSFEFRGVAPGPVELTVRRVGFAPGVVVLQVDGVDVHPGRHRARAGRHHPGPDRHLGHAGPTEPQ